MPWWRKLLALLGLTNDARVHVRASGIDVVITGDPKLVRRVLEAVRDELENKRRSRSRGRPIKFETDSHMVLPSELDEMDSPYIIPEHRPADPMPASGGTQVATDDDIVASEREATDDIEPPSEPTTVDGDGGPRIPMPQVSAVTPAGEAPTNESLESFVDSAATDDGERLVVDEFTDGGSDRGTDPDLQAEAELATRG